MLMRLSSRLLQATLITAIVYVTMLLDQAEQPGLQRADAAPLQADRTQSGPTPGPTPGSIQAEQLPPQVTLN